MGNFAAAKHALLKAIKKKADIDKAEEFKVFELLKPGNLYVHCLVADVYVRSVFKRV